ncbi:hypothetical protein [Streptomyces boluensis]|uniref:hypothetical protein n=1 Tax=Streptomyces boluensis TaxID=1775135 RepID=UPI0035E40612
MASEVENHEARRIYTEGVGDFAEWLTTEDQDGITRLCTMLGALVLARATNGSPLSEEILTTARGIDAGRLISATLPGSPPRDMRCPAADAA